MKTLLGKTVRLVHRPLTTKQRVWRAWFPRTGFSDMVRRAQLLGHPFVVKKVQR